MTQKDKDLLLKDLCARLYTCNCIYGTALTVTLADEQPLVSNQWLISNYDCYKDKFIVSNIVYASDTDRIVDIDNIRPYLFPLDKINGDMWSEYLATCVGGNASFPTLKSFEWCDEHHVDYRGLIPMGLAIDATNKNIY